MVMPFGEIGFCRKYFYIWSKVKVDFSDENKNLIKIWTFSLWSEDYNTTDLPQVVDLTQFFPKAGSLFLYDTLKISLTPLTFLLDLKPEIEKKYGNNRYFVWFCTDVPPMRQSHDANHVIVVPNNRTDLM